MDVLTVLTELAEAKGGQVTAWNEAQGVSVADYDALIDSVNANGRGECDKALAALSALGDDSIPDVVKTTLLEAIKRNKSTLDGIDVLGAETLKNSDVVYIDSMKCDRNIQNSLKGSALLTFIESIDGEDVAEASDAMVSCVSLVAVEMINLPKCKGAARMFAYCHSLKKVSFTEGSLTLLNSADSMFGQCVSLTSMTFPEGSLKELKTMKTMFSSDAALTSVTFPEGSLASVTDALGLFNKCESLPSVTFPEGGLASLENGSDTFNGCVALTSLNIQTESMPNLSVMSRMFYDCKGLTEDPLKRISLGNVTTMESAYMNCGSMTSFSHPETVSSTSFNSAFKQCFKLEAATLGTSAWRRVPTATDSTNCVFESCESLTVVTFAGGTAKMADADKMFYNCAVLTSVNGLDLSGLILRKSDISAAASLTEAVVEAVFSRITASTFYGCKALEECELSGTLRKSGMDLRPCVKLSAKSLYTWAVALYDWATNEDGETTDDTDHVLYMTAAQQEALLAYAGDAGESGETAYADAMGRGWTISE